MQLHNLRTCRFERTSCGQRLAERLAFTSQRVLALVAMAAVVATGGCGSNNPLGRLPVAGKVTFGGEPLESGNIEFAPTAGGTSSGAPIIAGEYKIATLQGLPPGSYLVRIHAAEGNSSPRTPEEAMLNPADFRPGIEKIPADYNSASKVTVEVKSGETNEFNFDVPKK